MKGPVPSIRNSNGVTEPEVKVKRKCGRPRNPIPRHKRVSHISAEERRRSKIQIGLQTLKEMLPRYESTGRDSKADVLTKAVDQTKDLIKGGNQRDALLQQLRAQKEALSDDIAAMRQKLPEGKLFVEETLTAEQRLEGMVSSEIQKDWRYYIFSFFVRALHKTFQDLTICSTLDTFNATTRNWANMHLSQAGFRSVAMDALSALSKNTSFIDSPAQMPQEALEFCRQGQAKAVTATITSADASPIPEPTPSGPHHQTASPRRSSGHRGHASRKRTKKTVSRKSPSSSVTDSTSYAEPNVPSSAEPRSTPNRSPGFLNAQFDALSAAAVKMEAQPSCSLPFTGTSISVSTSAETASPPKSDFWTNAPVMATDLPTQFLDSPSSAESGIALSYPRSSRASSVFGEFTGYESSLDQCYDTDVNTPASTSVSDNFLQPRSTESVFGDLEDIVNFDDLINSFENQPAHSSSSVPVTAHSQPLPLQQPGSYVDSSRASSGLNILEGMDSSVLPNMDLNLLDIPDSALMDIGDSNMLGNDSAFSNDIMFILNNSMNL